MKRIIFSIYRADVDKHISAPPYKRNQFRKFKNVAIVTSTYGEGEVPEMGIEFWNGPLHQDADHEKSKSQKDENRNNDCSSPYLHRKTFAVILTSGKPEVGGI